jgi:toxin-antitoxin system PIN domain toxin
MTKSSDVRFLLDVNVLVGLAFPSHSSHDAAHSWFGKESERLWATCALTQAGFVRVVSRLLGGSQDSIGLALAGLEQDCANPRHDFWAVDADLRDLSNSQRARMTGPNQVADMQLLILAYRHRGKLATFDTGLRQLASGTPYANSLLVL